MLLRTIFGITSVIVMLTACERRPVSGISQVRRTILEINADELPRGDRVYALSGCTLIDGKGGAPLESACIVVRGERIESVGREGDVEIPDDAEVIELNGLTVVPGFIDAHYHDENSDTLTSLYLANGITSVRDPGEWIESYAGLRASGKILPRLFLAGPHLDNYPPAHPEDAWIVRDAGDARVAVEALASQGATVIKVYYGLSLGMIRQICETAATRGLPVTAHLEITNAMAAIDAGLDGIEHITSFGTFLTPPRQVEVYKQKVIADKNARRRGRYEMWSALDFNGNKLADSLISFLVAKKTFVTPTLAVFERQPDKGDSVDVAGFKNMMKFVGMAHSRGVRIVVGSHSYVPYAALGFAFHREMELLKDAGLSNMQVILAATIENARFFRVEERLGSIEPGKLADMVVVEGNPLEDIRSLRNVRRVMMNGVWVR